MAVQIRSKRKKNFKSNEAMQFDDPATPSLGRAVEKPDDESSLNIRRSSRKPKPKKLSEDFEDTIPLDLKIKQEPLDEDEMTPTVYMSETPVFDTGIVENTASFVSPAGGARRETRKSFQNYLETLGYNSDFSKISEQEQLAESLQRSGKSSGKICRMNLKTESEGHIAQPWALPREEPSLLEQKTTSSKVRASSRTPRPKKTFSLVEEEMNMAESTSGIVSVDPFELTVQKKNTNKVKERKSLSGGDKAMISEQYKNRPTSKPQPILPPASKNEMLEPALDEMDSTPTRMSGRVRVPKRQFSLLEDESQSRTKREKVTSPDNVPFSEIIKAKQKLGVTPGEGQVTDASPLVVKRASVRRGKKKKEQAENTVDSCPGKVKKIIEDINIKREVDIAESSQSETEKKTVVKKGRDRIEKIVESLLLAKQSDLVTTSEPVPEEKTTGQKKGVKRKRESTGNEGAKKGKGIGAKKMKKNNEKEHIVLKLHIPHGKDKDRTKKDEKHHHKHHHHKHKKAKESETVVKKQKDKPSADIKTSKKEVPAKKTIKKKKVKKLNIKQEPEDDTHPHVKLIIKKSPTKSAKIAEVMMQDMSEVSSELPEGSCQDGTETVEKKPEVGKKSEAKKKKTDKKKKLPDVKKKPDAKKKPPNRKYKPLTMKPTMPRPFRKKKDKTMKARTVSAYSLFTKNRRKGLLEKEPNLDFATTSRRLAQMWKSLPHADQEYWKAKARAVRMPNGRDPTRSFLRSKRGSRYDSYNWSQFSDVPPSSTGTEAIDMAAYLKLLGESLCSIGMCLKRQDQMEVHGSLSVLLDTALCSIVPIFCLTSQLPEMAGCSHETQAQILDNLAYIIPGL